MLTAWQARKRAACTSHQGTRALTTAAADSERDGVAHRFEVFEGRGAPLSERGRKGGGVELPSDGSEIATTDLLIGGRKHAVR